MTRQTWTALVSAIVFVACAAGLALIPTPYITWSPGSTTDVLSAPGGKPTVEITEVRTYDTPGELDLTTVSVTTSDSRLALPEALIAYWLPDRDTLPRESVYQPGKSADQVEAEEAQMMQSSQNEAVVAALRAADQPVTERVQVGAVTINGPAQDRLKPGDFVVAVDDVAVKRYDQVAELVRKHKVGDSVSFVVDRGRQRLSVSIIAGASRNNPDVAAVGISVQPGYSHTAQVGFGIDPEIGGPSAGLIFALAIYDRLTPAPLVDGRHVAGTGEIDVDGNVGAIGGINQKIVGAEKAGATIFLVPAANCTDVATGVTDLRLVKVDTLETAISALTDLGDPAMAASVPGC